MSAAPKITPAEPRCRNYGKRTGGPNCAIPHRDGELCIYCRAVERGKKYDPDGVTDAELDRRDGHGWSRGRGR